MNRAFSTGCNRVREKIEMRRESGGATVLTSEAWRSRETKGDRRSSGSPRRCAARDDGAEGRAAREGGDEQRLAHPRLVPGFLIFVNDRIGVRRGFPERAERPRPPPTCYRRCADRAPFHPSFSVESDWSYRICVTPSFFAVSRTRFSGTQTPRMPLARRRAGPEPRYLSPQGDGRLLRSQYLLENSPLLFLTVNDVWLVMV